MSDENTNPDNTAPNYGELINNMKAESDRKLANLEASISNQLQQLPNLIQQSVAQYAAPPVQPDYTAQANTGLLDDEEAWAKKLEQRITNAVSKQVDSSLVNYEDRSVQRSQLYTDFPELSNPDHEVTQDVISRFQALSPEQKKDADQHLKSIVYQVASERGLKPVKFRKDDDNFSLSGNQGERHVAPEKEREQGMDGIKKGTRAWAEILTEVGAPIDIEDPKDKARLQELAKRTNWTSLEQSPTFTRTQKGKKY